MRDLEQGVMTLTPDNIEMEGRTELTQYIVLSWNLDYINKSKTPKETEYSNAFLSLKTFDIEIIIRGRNFS